jgi:glycerol-3-phosphate cytidylyltransferase
MTVRKIMTCGTFDLFHIGHVNMLRRAKELGTYLVVGVSSDRCNKEKNKKSIINQEERLKIVEACKYVDEVFIEDSLDEKQEYVNKYNIDLFVIGDDWKGAFDYLTCTVKYLSRTEDISTTLIKKENFPDIWPLTLYEKKIHIPLDNMLMNIFDEHDSLLVISPNQVTFLSLSMFIPILLINNNFFRCICFIVHDLLDRADGSLARTYCKKKFTHNSEFGAFLDALCDKIFVFIIGIFLINNYLLNIKMMVHVVSIGVRSYNYIGYIKPKNTKSTISGKMATFMENMAFSTYFILPDTYFQFLMFSSIILSIQSLYEKVK